MNRSCLSNFLTDVEKQGRGVEVWCRVASIRLGDSFFFFSFREGRAQESNLRVGSRPARRAIHILFLRGRETIVLRAIESGLDRDTLGYFFELSFFCSGKIEFATKNTLINELTFSSCSSR